MTTPKIKKVDYKEFGRDLSQRARERNAAIGLFPEEYDPQQKSEYWPKAKKQGICLAFFGIESGDSTWVGSEP